jgi:hypothetical protein
MLKIGDKVVNEEKNLKGEVTDIYNNCEQPVFAEILSGGEKYIYPIENLVVYNDRKNIFENDRVVLCEQSEGCNLDCKEVYSFIGVTTKDRNIVMDREGKITITSSNFKLYDKNDKKETSEENM